MLCQIAINIESKIHVVNYIYPLSINMMGATLSLMLLSSVQPEPMIPVSSSGYTSLDVTRCLSMQAAATHSLATQLIQPNILCHKVWAVFD